MNDKTNWFGRPTGLLLATAIALVTGSNLPNVNGQTAATAADTTKQNEEILAAVDFSSPRAYDTSYCFAGYGLDGDTEGRSVDSGISVKNAESAEGGNPGACGTATLDTSKLEVPSGVVFDYIGWALGVAVDLKAPFKATDLDGYSIAFDAKVTGTKPLGASKLLVNFVVDDDVIGKDDDAYEDVALGLTRGEDGGADTIALGSEFKSYSFKLKNDLKLTQGSLENLQKHTVKRLSVSIQAQGNISDVGTDADNVLYVDNIRLIKTTAK